MSLLKRMRKVLFGKEESIYGTEETMALDVAGTDTTTMVFTASSADKPKEVKEMQAKFEVFPGEGTPEWFFRLRANNGKIIAQSEGYSRRRNALKGIRAIKKCAGKAKVVILK